MTDAVKAWIINTALIVLSCFVSLHFDAAYTLPKINVEADSVARNILGARNGFAGNDLVNFVGDTAERSWAFQDYIAYYHPWQIKPR